MIPSGRFARLETQVQGTVQRDCPVYVHCTCRSVDRISGAVFLQVRMVNCGERPIGTVYLYVEGMDFCGRVCYTVRELPLTDCAAAPHTVFGEERVLVLPRRETASLRVTVERVLFEDGGLWHRSAPPVALQEAGWEQCACGMPNPPDSPSCRLCGKKLATQRPSEACPTPEQAERPAPILRSFIPYVPDAPCGNGPGRHALPRFLVTLLCIFGMIATISATTFLFFCLLRYKK